MSRMDGQEQFNANTVEMIEDMTHNVEHGLLNRVEIMTGDVKTATTKERVRLAPNDYLKEQRERGD